MSDNGSSGFDSSQNSSAFSSSSQSSEGIGLSFLQRHFEHDEEEQVMIQEAQSIIFAKDIVGKHGGSVPGRMPNIDRDREGGEERLMRDYFGENPIYGEHFFRRRFRMRRPRFMKIVEAVQQYDKYFVKKADACRLLGLSPIQKCTAAIRQLAYGCAADSIDEYVRISETTAIKTLKRFTRAIVDIYEDEYLRTPNQADIERLLAMNAARGFPGMLGSLDCMHWPWKNCPSAWAGQYTGKEKSPTLVLEAVVDQELWLTRCILTLTTHLFLRVQWMYCFVV